MVSNLILLVLAIPNVFSSDWSEAPYCRTLNNSTTEWRCVKYRDFPPDFDNASAVEKLELNGHRYERSPSENLTSNHLQLYKLPNLVELVLENDVFYEIERGAFRNGGKLLKLTLQWNEMKKLDLQVLADVPNLQKLQINNIFLPVEDFEYWEFPKLENLTELALESLKISSLKPNMFKNLKSLQILELSYGQLTTLDDREVFRPLKNLKVLKYPWNSIRFVDPEVFADLQNLKNLNLYGNNLHEGFKNGTQFHNPNLTTLSLGNCELKYIEEELLANLGKLKGLNLGDNHLSDIPPKTFASLKNLQALWIYNNQIKTLEPNVFPGNLRYLDLTGNQLKSLDWKVRRYLKSLERIGLSENPWQCDCQVLYLQKFLKQRRIQYIHNFTIENTTEISIPRCKTFGEKGEPVPSDTREGPEWIDMSLEQQLDCLAFPNILKLSADTKPKFGENLNLKCNFTGDLPLQVVWMKGDVILRNFTLSEDEPLLNGTLKEYNDQLNISNFKEEDAGLYKVIVSNEAGESEKNLDVIGEPSTLNSAGNAKQSFLFFFQCLCQVMVLRSFQ